MAKFFGPIGFATTVETRPGVWIRNTRRLQTADQVNDDINISNEISIVADPFANGNFHSMRYIGFMGAKWKISSVEVKYPRLILTLGGVWNGQQKT